MACSSAVVAHNNKFNRAVLGDDAAYFSTVHDLGAIFEEINPAKIRQQKVNNLEKIKNQYNWDLVTNAYEQLFYEATDNR